MTDMTTLPIQADINGDALDDPAITAALAALGLDQDSDDPAPEQQAAPLDQAPEQQASDDPALAAALAAFDAMPSSAVAPSEGQPTPEGQQSMLGASMLGAIGSDISQGIVEAPGAIGRGAINAANETSHAANSAAAWLNRKFLDLGYINLDLDPSTPLWENSEARETRLRALGVDVTDERSLNQLLIPEFIDEAESTTGKLITGVTQFAVGMVGAGRLLQGTAKGIPGAMATGAIADATVFNPHEQRLSNLVESVPALRNPVTEYLSADPEDSEAEGRFKNAVEGLVLGGAVEGIFLGVRALRKAKAGDLDGARADTEAVERIMADEGIDVESALVSADNLPPAKPRYRADGVDPETGRTRWTRVQSDNAAMKGVDGGTPVSAAAATDAAVGPTARPAAQPRPAVVVDKDQLAVLKDALLKRTEVDGADDGTQLAAQALGRDFNFENIASEDSVKEVIDSISDIFAEDILRVKGGARAKDVGPDVPYEYEEGVRTWAAANQNAKRFYDEIGANPEQALQRMRLETKDVFHLDARVRAQRTFMVSLTDELDQVAEAVIAGSSYKGKAGKDLEDYFEKMAKLSVEVVAMTKGQQTNIARAMGIMRQTAGVNERLLQGLDGMGRDVELLRPQENRVDGLSVREAALRYKAAGGSLKSRVAVLRGGFVNKFWGTHNEYWINAILSSPKTHVVNTITSGMQLIYKPAERMLGGAMTGNGQMVREGFHQIMGLRLAMGDALTAAWKVLRSPDGRNILDLNSSKLDDADMFNVITAKTYGRDGKLDGSIIDMVGQIIRTPGRALATQDELVKTLSLRSRVYGIAMREAKDMGLSPDGIADHIAKRMDSAINKATGEANLHSEYGRAGIREAREATFTQSLDYGIGKNLQDLTAKMPALKIVLPFVRTPTNLIRWTWQRTPGLNRFQRQHREDLKSGDPERVGLAVAREAQAVAITGMAALAAFDGRITGSGPESKPERDLLMATGWRPNSVVITKDDGTVEYVQVSRADPFFMLASIIADMVDVSKRTGDGQIPVQDWAGGLGIAVMKNLANKTYLEGIGRAVEAFSGDERALTYWLKGQAASYLPTGVQTFKTDELMREAVSVVEMLKRKTPGLSKTLDPKRNVLGEVVVAATAFGPDALSPFANGIDTGADMEVFKELSQFDKEVRPPLPRMGSIDLRADEFKAQTPDENGWRQSAYDRYLELSGTVRIHGKTLREALEAEIKSPRYQKLTEDAWQNGEVYRGAKSQRISLILARYREVAKMKLLKENRPLAEAVRTDELNRRRALSSSRSQQIEWLNP